VSAGLVPLVQSPERFQLKRLRSKLTYSNVISTVCLFLLVGGGTAFAANHLGKNSVGSKQLKKNSVTASKIANGAVAGSKINLSTLGTVPSASTAANANHAATADSATNAANANHAATADSATNAGHANTADNASATGGIHSAKLEFLSGTNAPPTTIFSADGLTLRAECSGGLLEFTGQTSVNNAEIYASGNTFSTFKGTTENEFEAGQIVKIGEEIGSQNNSQGQLVYSTPSGAVVTIEFSLNDEVVNGGLSNSGCQVKGIAQFS
jgi:hypothetical protein